MDCQRYKAAGLERMEMENQLRQVTGQYEEAMYRLTTIPTLADRFVLPPYHREMAIEAWEDPLDHKGETGLGYVQIPIRGA